MIRRPRLLAGLTVALALACTAPASAAVWINEVHYDNAGTDVGEGVELAGPAGTDLGGMTLALYNGFDGRVYRTVALSGAIGAQQTAFGTTWFAVPGMQNGAPDGVAVIAADGRVLEFLSYEGSMSALDGPAAGLASTAITPFERPSTPAGRSLQRAGDGSWYAPRAASPGVPNPGQVLRVTPPPAAPVATAPAAPGILTPAAPGADAPQPAEDAAAPAGVSLRRAAARAHRYGTHVLGAHSFVRATCRRVPIDGNDFTCSIGYRRFGHHTRVVIALYRAGDHLHIRRP